MWFCIDDGDFSNHLWQIRAYVESEQLHETESCVVHHCLFIGLSPWPWLSLIGCMLCGFSVGIFWPGTFSKAAVAINGGGTVMFALLALGGNIGCSFGSTIVGMVSGIVGNDLQAGLLCAIIFFDHLVDGFDHIAKTTPTGMKLSALFDSTGLNRLIIFLTDFKEALGLTT